MELPYLVDEYLLKIREIQNQELAMHLFFLLLKSRKRYQNNYQSGPRCYVNAHAATAHYMITYPWPDIFVLVRRKCKCQWIFRKPIERKRFYSSTNRKNSIVANIGGAIQWRLSFPWTWATNAASLGGYIPFNLKPLKYALPQENTFQHTQISFSHRGIQRRQMCYLLFRASRARTADTLWT